MGAFQDPFKYSYPPLPDDNFQTPTGDGPVITDDDTLSKDGEMESKDALESSFNSEVAVTQKKVHFIQFRVLTILILCLATVIEKNVT